MHDYITNIHFFMLAQSSKVQLGHLPSHILQLMSTSQNITNVALCFWINLSSK